MHFLAKSRAVRWSVTLYMPPGFMRVEKHEQIGRAVSLVFAIVALRLTRLPLGLARALHQSTVLDFRRSKPPDAWDRPLRHKGRAHPPYGRHSYRSLPECTTSCGATASGIVLGQTPADRLARQPFMFHDQLDHLTGQQIERPALTAFGWVLEQTVATSNAVSLQDSLRAAPGRASSAQCEDQGWPSTKRRLVR